MITKKKKIVLLVGAAALVGSAAFAMTGTGNAGQRQGNASSRCNQLASLASEHQRFIANEQANPNANSRARIARSQAIIGQIRQQQQSAGCNNRQGGGAQGGGRQGGGGQGAQRGGNGRCNQLASLASEHQRFIANEQANPNANSRARIARSQAIIGQIRQQQQSAGCNNRQGGGAQGGGQAGQVVCKGSTVTLSGEGGAPAASSNQFPEGTRLRVTNLNNNRSTTVKVNAPSGSCVLLNNAAFEQVREQGKNVIQNVRVERVG
ncbi:hypothetical protein ACFYXH_36155 [Streptomyces sp. NPDC002730]|uniref:hypothetical protein n=1 Tax=Streptomyces sp. NPDC002730 TaxID=3364662 RepID=UPI003687BDEF